MSTVTQRQSIHYNGTHHLLHYYLSQLSGDLELIEHHDKKAMKIFNAVTLIQDTNMVTLEVCCTL